LAPQVEELTQRVEELFLSLDANLKFRVEPFAAKTDTEEGQTKDTAAIVADLRGVTCPLNFVKAKLALEKIEVGEILEVLLDGGEPVRNVPASFSDQGQDVLEVEDKGDHFFVRVRRKK
jgi:sulfite reductase (ferredoxin)